MTIKDLLNYKITIAPSLSKTNKTYYVFYPLDFNFKIDYYFMLRWDALNMESHIEVLQLGLSYNHKIWKK